MNQSPIKLAVLLSGGGTTLQNLIDQIAAKKLNASIELVITSREDVRGVERARSAGLETCIISRREYHSVNHFSKRVFTEINRNDIDLICLAGWLCLLNIPMRYENRIMNIHPALLPSFGGKGMFGHRVHEAVLNYGAKVSGCTVHFVDNEYDQGPVILQRAVPVLDDDTPDQLAARVFEEEKIAYPEAIRLFQQKRLQLEGRCVRILQNAVAT